MGHILSFEGAEATRRTNPSSRTLARTGDWRAAAAGIAMMHEASRADARLRPPLTHRRDGLHHHPAHDDRQRHASGADGVLGPEAARRRRYAAALHGGLR